MKSESASHGQRVNHLIARFTGNRALELCTAFDEAVEFAACEGKSLADAITEFFAEDWGPGQEELRAVLSNPIAPTDPLTFPVAPKAVARLLRTSDETSSVIELERIAARDQVMTARLLGMANSARFGLRFEIVRVGDAIQRLGIPMTRQVLLAACLGGLFASRPLQELWEHSQQVADAAHELAGLCGVDRETAYAAGLLHDIGRLAFAGAAAGTQLAQQSWLAAGFPLAYAETLVYGTDHAAFGARLLNAWELPPEIVNAVALHHRPECSDSRLNALLYLAEDLCARADPAQEDLWPNLRRANAADRSGIDIEHVEALNIGRQLACA